jgi:hypothetical protein
MMENPVFHFMGEFRVYFFNNSLLFHFSDSILLVCVKFFDSHLARFFTGGCKDSLQAGRSDSLRQKPFSRSTHGISVNAAAKGLLNIFGASSGYPFLDALSIGHCLSLSISRRRADLSMFGKIVDEFGGG